MAKTIHFTKKKEKVCFIISPLGTENSETRRKANGLINSVLKPTLSTFGFTVIAPHEITKTGSITVQVIELLLNADLVIANLTELNPNVMYELAVRHAKRLPVICLAENDTILPFDIATERAIFYSNDMAGVEDLKRKLETHIEEAKDETDSDNPIYRAMHDFVLKEITAKTGDNAQKLILQTLSKLSLDVERLNNQRYSTSKLNITDISSRPREIEASVLRFNIGGEQWLLILTIEGVTLYEIFLKKGMDGFQLPVWVQKGWVIMDILEPNKARFDFRYKDKDGYNITIEGLSFGSNRWYLNI